MVHDLLSCDGVARVRTRSGDEADGPHADADGSIGRSARQLLRAVGGGLLIGLPLLFTMEMWFHSFLLPSWKIVVLLVVAFGVVIGYTAVSGFRRERSRAELVVDAVETMGIAAVVAAVALLLLGRIDLQTGLRDAIGKVALQMIPIAFGVSLAGTHLAAADDEAEDAEDQGGPGRGAVGPFGRMVVAAGAALLFALNVAVTEEPVLLGVEAEWWLLLAVVAASLVMTLGIVFYADFRGGRAPDPGDSPLDHPLTETVAAYAISVGLSLLLLWSFGRTEGVSSSAIAGQTVMLAFIASFGAAAGRLLVGGRAEG
jgi:putative integral membrane protein (TIGR02587 family)